jgi:hypothetical protein
MKVENYVFQPESCLRLAVGDISVSQDASAVVYGSRMNNVSLVKVQLGIAYKLYHFLFWA